MKQPSLKLNFLLNNTRLLLNIVIPLITFPYISRVLGPQNLGKIEYVNSIISYFILFTALGIPTYGIREIARNRNNPIECSKTVWELTCILCSTILFGYVAYFLAIHFIPFLYTDRLLFYVMAPALFLSDFSYEWFYIGIEDQRYITVRFIIIKIIQLCLIFFCIKQPDDFILYAIIMIGLNGFSTVFNIFRLKTYIHFIPISSLNIKRHFKSILVIFTSIVAVNVYIHLDVTMIGIMIDDTAVGLYSVANKLVRIIITVVTSLSIVMIPRIENCLKNGDTEKYRTYLNTSLRFILLLGLPCFLGLAILAPQIIYIFAGKQYTSSALSVQLLSPIIIIVSLANFVGLQVLYPNRKEIYYTISVSVAAVVNVVFNLFMIPILKQNGAILGTVLAEMVGLIIQIIFARHLLKDTKLCSYNTLTYIIAALIMGAVVLYMRSFFTSPILSIVICVLTGAIVYVSVLILMREETMKMIYLKIKKLRKKM